MQLVLGGVVALLCVVVISAVSFDEEADFAGFDEDADFVPARGFHDLSRRFQKNLQEKNDDSEDDAQTRPVFNCEYGHSGKCRSSRGLFGVFRFRFPHGKFPSLICSRGHVCVKGQCCKVNPDEKTIKNPVCPANTKSVETISKRCMKMCKKDSHCPGETMCCASGCHQVCQFPVEKVLPDEETEEETEEDDELEQELEDELETELEEELGVDEEDADEDLTPEEVNLDLDDILAELAMLEEEMGYTNDMEDE